MPYPYWKPKDYKWTNASLKQTDSSFAVARKAATDTIEDMVSKNPQPDSDAWAELATRYYPLWKKDPKNALALYRWALCSYYGIPVRSSMKTVNQTLIPVAEVLVTSSTNDAEYLRLRFLVEANLNEFATELIPLGKKLMVKYPNDPSVKYRMINILPYSDDMQNRKMAIELAKQLINKYPSQPVYQKSLATAHFISWASTYNEESGREAIKAYEKYIRVIDDPVAIANVRKRIADIKNDIAEHKKKAD